ncbi:MAG: zinc ribbon domain-containing protein [Planctomycetes bacterium]|nr:zinc ribbon domain-containing protein [Planctomycetota bacterium]
MKATAAIPRCPRCHAGLGPHEAYCTDCGAPVAGEAGRVDVSVIPVAQGLGGTFGCQSCGAQVACEPGQRGYRCVWCDSSYVVESPAGKSAVPSPDYVLPFSVDERRAAEAFQRWLGTGLFRPGDLRRRARLGQVRGVYLPFWLFGCRTETTWSASIGEHYWATETYTTTDSKGRRVTRTRRVQRTEWFPLSGRYHRRYADVPVSAAAGLPQDQATAIGPFPLESKRPYRAGYLAGWMAEDPSTGRDAAWPTARDEVLGREGRGLAGHMPGDTHRELRHTTSYHEVTADLALLPVWIHPYRFGDKVHVFLVNGATGKAWGTAPVSWPRVAAAVLLGAAALASLIGLVAWLTR